MPTDCYISSGYSSVKSSKFEKLGFFVLLCYWRLFCVHAYEKITVEGKEARAVHLFITAPFKRGCICFGRKNVTSERSTEQVGSRIRYDFVSIDDSQDYFDDTGFEYTNGMQEEL